MASNRTNGNLSILQEKARGSGTSPAPFPFLPNSAPNGRLRRSPAPKQLVCRAMGGGGTPRVWTPTTPRTNHWLEAPFGWGGGGGRDLLERGGGGEGVQGEAPLEGTLGYVACALAADSTKRRKKMGSSVAYKTIGTFLSQNMGHEDACGRATEMQSSGCAAVRQWPTLSFTHWTCKFDLNSEFIR